MNIAYLGWGSLIWNPGDLPITGGWLHGGPILPIEFSRISKDDRLTLVIDGVNGVPVETCFAYCACSDVLEAIEKLRIREGASGKYIGHVVTADSHVESYMSPYHGQIAEWGREMNIDVVIWTALPSNFVEKTNSPYTADNALKYIINLQGKAMYHAIEYIDNAPDIVMTPFRNRFMEKRNILSNTAL
jgi:hypothetical protein